MIPNFLTQKPIHDPNKRQPWYVKWSEGNAYAILAHNYVDVLLVGSVIGVLATVALPFLNNILFFSSILLSPIPIVSIILYYYFFRYNYKTSNITYYLKPTFLIIILYQLFYLIIISSILFIY